MARQQRRREHAGRRAQEFKSRVSDLGLSIPSVFAEFNGEPDQAKRLFEFWKDIGTEVIVAEPPAGSYDMLEKLCEEYNMKLALHNHQRTKSEYWSPEIVLQICATRGPRIGACADVGQWAVPTWTRSNAYGNCRAAFPVST